MRRRDFDGMELYLMNRRAEIARRARLVKGMKRLKSFGRLMLHSILYGHRTYSIRERGGARYGCLDCHFVTDPKGR